VMDGGLWLSMMPTSAKVRDLARDPRILLHSVITGPEPAPEIKLRGAAQAGEITEKMTAKRHGRGMFRRQRAGGGFFVVRADLLVKAQTCVNVFKQRRVKNARFGPGQNTGNLFKRRPLWQGERTCHSVKNPRVAHCGLANHDAVHPGFAYHGDCAASALDAAVANDRNARAFDNPRERGKVKRPRVELRGVTRMKGDGRCAGILRGVKEVERKRFARDKSEARFERDRKRLRRNHAADDFRDAARLWHECGATPLGRDFAHRATGVDVNGDKAAKRCDLFRGSGHFIGLRAKEVSHERAFTGKFFKQVPRRTGRLEQTRCARHFGKGEGRAMLMTKKTHGGIGESRHGREKNRRHAFKGAKSKRGHCGLGS